LPENSAMTGPFAGTGTTGALAKKYGRNYILIERDKNYCKVIQDRLDSIQPREEWLKEYHKED